MADLWLPGARRSYPGNSAGSMNGDGSRKLGLHSTEGSTIEGAVAAYRANNSWPHLTVDAPRRRVEQHVPLDVAARSFRNLPGGADATNRDGNYMIQIELVGTATRPASIGSPDDLDWLGETVIGPACRLTGVPLVCTVDFMAYPASYGVTRVRLSPAKWDAYSGLLGHMHVPDNVHGDPGAIDIGRILAAARQEDDHDMTEAQERTLNRINESLGALREHEKAHYDAGQKDFAAVQKRLGELEQKIDTLAAAEPGPTP